MIYMKYGDGKAIKGDVTEPGHQDWIELQTVQFGIGRLITGTVGSMKNREATGQPTLSEITISKTLDSSSPLLFQDALINKKAVPIEIDFTRTGQKEPYLKLTLKEVLLAAYSLGGSAGGSESENLTLNFAYIEYAHSTMKTDGSGESSNKVIFDLTKGVPTK